MTKSTATTAAVLLALSAAASARSGTLDDLARDAFAVQAAAVSPASSAAQGGATSALEAARRIAGGASAMNPAAGASGTSAPGAWADPSPVNYPSKGVTRAGQFVFSAETQARVKAFDDFSATRCSDCEGGKAYDSWVRQFMLDWIGNDRFETRIAGMKVGESFSWKGSVSVGTLTVVGEQPIGPFPCKQLRYRLVRGKASAERPGLFCFTKGEFTNPAWREIL